MTNDNKTDSQGGLFADALDFWNKIALQIPHPTPQSPSGGTKSNLTPSKPQPSSGDNNDVTQLFGETLKTLEGVDPSMPAALPPESRRSGSSDDSAAGVFPRQEPHAASTARSTRRSERGTATPSRSGSSDDSAAGVFPRQEPHAASTARSTRRSERGTATPSRSGSSDDSAAGVFPRQEPHAASTGRSRHADETLTFPELLIGSEPCRPPVEISTYQYPATPSTSKKVNYIARTVSPDNSSYMRNKSPTSKTPASPTPAAARQVVSTQNKVVKNQIGCIRIPKFIEKLLSKFSPSKNTDNESVGSTTARSATPSRPASATARSATPSRPASATARSATPSRPGSATARSATPSRPGSATARSATPSRPGSATPSRAGSPSRPASITATPSRAGSPSRPAKKSLKERIQELWHKLKLHKSADGRGDGRKEEATGSYAIFLDTARWFKKIPNKVSTSSQKLLSEFFDRCSRAATTISSFKIPKLPERPVVNQQPLTFTRNTSPRSSVSKTFSDGVRAFKERYSEVMENMRNSTDTSYTPSQQNQTTSFSRKASGLFKRIQGAYIDYQEHQAYNSHMSSHTSSGPTLSFPTPPTSQDIQNAANKFNSGAFWGAKFLKERTIYAADSAYSSAASRASQVKRYAKNLYDWKDRYTAPDVHALWWGRR